MDDISSGAVTTLQGSIAVIRFHHLPVNTLGHAMRVAVHREINKALADAAVGAVVLAGEGRGFCAGAQITEFASGEIAATPTAHDIWELIEASPKPFIAAIHGYALGGGLEFAMACHYRIAAPDAVFAAPEVGLGLLPGAGGTQRLPRAVGVKRALRMMLTGERTPAAEFTGTALLDGVAEGELMRDALAFANGLVASTPRFFAQPRLPRLRDITVPPAEGAQYFAGELARAASEHPGMHAPPAIVRCVEAAVNLDFDEGLKFERARFQELVNNEQSLALRAAFFAGRKTGGR